MEDDVRFGARICAMVLSLGLAMLQTVPLQAMPPHPKKIRQAISEGPGGIQRLARRQQAMVKRSMNRPMRSFPTSGNRKIPVIVIAYSDMALASVSTKTFYENLLNGATVASLSMRKYYQDMSGGALNLTIDVLGPYTAANTASYYGENDASEYDLRPATLVGEAIDKAELAGVDWTQYDNDDDGEVDVVMVIHAGVGEESDPSAPATAIWSHAWDLDSGKEYSDGTGARTYDGKKINNYSIQPEYVSSAGDSTIGVFCHEFGHVLGLPDMYDTTYETHGVGDYSIMAGGSWLGPNDGDVPSPFLAWEKAFLGWLTVKYPDGTVVSAASQGAAASMLADGSLAGVGVSLAVLAGLGVLGFFGWRRREIRSIVLPLLVMLALPAVIVTVAGCSDAVNAVLGGSLLSNQSGSSLSAASSTTSFSSTGSTSSVSSIAGPGSVSLGDIEVSHTAIKIPLGDPAGKQYYLIENKVKTAGTWTAYLPGSGLIISHIHDAVVDAYIGGNAVNDNSPDGGTTKQARIHGVNIVEADNNGQLWNPDAPCVAADYFQSRSFTPATAPKTFYYTATATPWSPSGKADSKVYIENISAAGSTMTFTYSYK